MSLIIGITIMTTIVYKDKEIVCESYLCQGDMIVDPDFDKVVSTKEFLIAVCGDPRYIRDLVELYYSGTLGKKDYQSSATGVFWDREAKTLWELSVGVEGVGDYKYQLDPNKYYSHGSGSSFAYGALDAGASAVEAVKIAVNRDVNSGGKIKRYKLR